MTKKIFHALAETLRSMVDDLVLWLREHVVSASFGALILISGACLVVFFVSLAKAGIQPPPIYYEQSAYRAANPVVVPGRVLTFTPALKIRAEGVNISLAFTRSWWDITHNRAAVDCHGVIIPSDVQPPRDFPATWDYADPVDRAVPDLPPGEYWYYTNVSSPGYKQTSHQVYAVVKRLCP